MDGVHPFFKGKALGTRLHFGGKTVVAVVSLLRVLARNVVVAKTSYQMLEILSFSDRERALPLSTEIGVLFQPLSLNSLMYDQPATKMSWYNGGTNKGVPLYKKMFSPLENLS